MPVDSAGVCTMNYVRLKSEVIGQTFGEIAGLGAHLILLISGNYVPQHPLDRVFYLSGLVRDGQQALWCLFM
jgi:hypothetical protein